MGRILKISNQPVGEGKPVFIIAEAGVNHNGDAVLAKRLIAAAAEAGADAVKFQTFTAETLVTATAAQADYQKKNTGQEESQYAMLKRLELSQENHRMLSRYAKEKNIIFLSTPFSETDADFLESLDVPAYKAPSGEITNLPYLRHLAKKGKPMIVSTGMSDLAETKTAVATILAEGNNQIIVLHSTSNYPPSFASLNLNVLQTLRRELGDSIVGVGYSDNGSPGTIADIVAVSLGAVVIEKHFTLDKNLPGPDQPASLNPQEFKKMVEEIRLTEKILGSYEKQCTPEELAIKAVARKSIVAAQDIERGLQIRRNMLVIKRPGDGIEPRFIEEIAGRIASKNIKKDSTIKWEDLKE